MWQSAKRRMPLNLILNNMHTLINNPTEITYEERVRRASYNLGVLHALKRPLGYLQHLQKTRTPNPSENIAAERQGFFDIMSMVGDEQENSIIYNHKKLNGGLVP